MANLFVLFEHASGYALFRVKEFEEVGMLLPQVEESVTDVSKFNSVVKLVGFSPFKTAAKALENVNSISEGVVPHDLAEFLQTFLPASTKKNKNTLGISDPKLGSAISECIGVSCLHTGAVPEIVRGIRVHFHNLVKGFTAVSASKAQLGLGHSYSRSKVKFNVNRVDNMIIQSIALLDQLDKDVNTFSMRIREWYSYHFPELIKIVPENYLYAKVASFIKNRKELSEEKLEGLEELVMDAEKAQAILDASRSSMGMDISVVDLLNIELFATRVVALADYRKELSQYLKTKMHDVAPNLATLIGEQVGARLIAQAGSLVNLAKYPASTVQILGAEKALFRALKTRTNTPKYGLLFHSTYIGKTPAKNKGRISRYLANKCSIASRIDCFSENPTCIFGEKMKEQVEDRIKFYETGDIPRTNLEVMKEAIEEHDQELKKKKKKDKKKKRKREEAEEEDENLAINNSHDNNIDGHNSFVNNDTEAVEEPPRKKKKKKKKQKQEQEME